jgi:hypothetical protein
MTQGPTTAIEEPDPWVYFVHGTTAGLWGAATEIRADRSGGQLGTGFYTFEDTNWGRQVASAWARRKVASVEDEPILIRVKMRRADYRNLEREDIGDEAIEAAYNTLYRDGQTGKELVVGPVTRRGVDGQRVPDRSLPLQFKFETGGLAKLTFDGVLPVS